MNTPYYISSTEKKLFNQKDFIYGETSAKSLLIIINKLIQLINDTWDLTAYSILDCGCGDAQLLIDIILNDYRCYLAKGVELSYNRYKMAKDNIDIVYKNTNIDITKLIDIDNNSFQYINWADYMFIYSCNTCFSKATNQIIIDKWIHILANHSKEPRFLLVLDRLECVGLIPWKTFHIDVSWTNKKIPIYIYYNNP